jgi:hypothetical protein
MIQLVLAFVPDWQRCKHSGWISHAEVPAGFYCDKCTRMIWRYAPPAKDEPSTLGYQSADWAWRFVRKQPWTVDDGEPRV